MAKYNYVAHGRVCITCGIEWLDNSIPLDNKELVTEDLRQTEAWISSINKRKGGSSCGHSLQELVKAYSIKPLDWNERTILLLPNR